MKEKIITATKKLLWKHGYNAVSPNMILKKSGAGKGSLYHHFDGKQDVAKQALEVAGSEMIEAMRRDVFSSKSPAKEKVKCYLLRSRPALNGCRMGRMTYDNDVFKSDLRIPVEEYFSALDAELIVCLNTMKSSGELAEHIDVGGLSTSLQAVIQGGYVLARAYNDKSKLDDAVQAAISMLNLNDVSSEEK